MYIQVYVVEVTDGLKLSVLMYSLITLCLLRSLFFPFSPRTRRANTESAESKRFLSVDYPNDGCHTFVYGLMSKVMRN
jgi:hypothetical protein